MCAEEWKKGRERKEEDGRGREERKEHGREGSKKDDREEWWELTLYGKGRGETNGIKYFDLTLHAECVDG